MVRKFTYGEVTGELNEKICVLKKDTPYLEGIDEQEIKEILLGFSNAYVLLNNGNLFKDGKWIYQNIKQIWFYRFDTVLGITNDYCIVSDEQNSICSFIGGQYKKIVKEENMLLALAENGNLKVLTSLEECVGITYENLVNISDIGIDNEKAFVIKNGKKEFLFVE